MRKRGRCVALAAMVATARGVDPEQYGRLVLDLHSAMSRERLLELGRTHASKFRRAHPYPHVAIDNFLPPEFLREVCAEYPEQPEAQIRKNATWDCTHSTGTRNKCSTELSGAMDGQGKAVWRSPYSRALFSMLLGPDFVDFLETLTGIEGLISDNAFQGSGFDQTLPGGALGVHTDFHYHKNLALTRRVNTFVYCNQDWKEEYGGHLELWSATSATMHSPRPRPDRMERRYLPSFNRFFVFATGDHSFHGHPMPLNTSSVGRNRRSVAMYYYTNGAYMAEHHLGQTITPEQPATSTLKCSGVPEHHKTTCYATCDDFKSRGTYRDDMVCIKKSHPWEYRSARRFAEKTKEESVWSFLAHLG